MDFNLKKYRELLDTLNSLGYEFQTISEFLESPLPQVLILRHDVEAKYQNALEFAQIQASKGIRSTFYFRILPYHFRKDIVLKIASMGHEVGYHYDDLSNCNGNYKEAILRFEENLAILKEIAPVKTICMEGAPLSKWDNRDLWKTYNYRDYGIKGEPYFDIDFSKVFYLTDTGRRWDGKGSVRDKVGGRRSAVSGQESTTDGTIGTSGTNDLEHGTWNLELTFRHTDDIIAAARSGLLPDQVMFTFHPQRWTDKPLPWVQELVMQNVKNAAKRIVLKRIRL